MDRSPEDTRIEQLCEDLKCVVVARHETGGIGKAFLIAALTIGQSRNGITLFHYTAFYNIHHSLELLLKGVLGLPDIEKNHIHSLTKLMERNPDLVDGVFSENEKELMARSDALNSDMGELRYYKPPHKVFDWTLFVQLGELGKRLVELDITRNEPDQPSLSLM